MIGGDGINDESNKTAPAPTRNTDLTKYSQKPTERKRVVCTQTTHMINSPIDAANAA